MPTTYKNVLECYEAIGRFLTESVPEPWQSIVVDFEIIEIDDVSEDCIVYTPLKSPTVEKQFFINNTNFANCFFQLARLTSTPEKGLFRKCKYALYQGGRYKVDFEY